MRFYLKNGLSLISSLAFSTKRDPAVVKYSPSKTKLLKKEVSNLPHTSPESVGISSSLLVHMLDALEKEERANLHSLVVIKDGFLILECSRRGYSPLLGHLSHSMSKTVTGMLIGMLVDDGKLTTDDTLGKFFPEYDIHPDTAAVTVENLLIMSSGIPFSEIGAVTDNRWCETFLGCEPAFNQGEKFAYNSMNSYMLMAISHKIINDEYGIGVMEFLKKRLFDPLGISEYFWEVGPDGIEKGGWGLYLSAESWAKLGVMMLADGVYNGKRILSENWVINSVGTQSITPSETGDFNYGYQLWVARSNQHFLFNGMLGQNVLIIPENNIVVAINSGNNELFQESPALKILREYLGGEIKSCEKSQLSLKKKCELFFENRLWITPMQRKRGVLELLSLKPKTPFDENFNPILKKFVFAENNQGILPLFIRVMQNNYQGGLDSIEFIRNNRILTMITIEGGQEYRYNVGFYDYEYNLISYNSELYTVGALANSKRLGNDTILWNIELIYPEMPNTRQISLRLSNDGCILTVSQSEIPNENVAESFFDSIPALGAKSGFLLDMLEGQLGKNFIQKRAKELFSPELHAVLENAADFDKLLEAENKKISEKFAQFALVRMLINKLTDSENEEEQSAKPPSLRGMVFSALMGKIFPKNRNSEENTD